MAYSSTTTGPPTPFTGGTLRIWSGRPGDLGSTILFGDTTTDRLAASTDTAILRIRNTVAPWPGIAPTTDRRIWQNTLAVAPAAPLPPGTYWVDWALTSTGTNFAPLVTVDGTRGLPGWNARHHLMAWGDALDVGFPASAPDVPQDTPFKLNGTVVAPPPVPTLTATNPASGTNENSPKVIGTATPGSTVKVYAGNACTGTPAATGTAAALAAPGIPVSVADNSTTSFVATAENAAGTSLCSAPIVYVEATPPIVPDTVAPETTISKGPKKKSKKKTATFEFTSSEAGSTFECSLNGAPFAPCTSPATVKGKKGKNTFEVRAIDAAKNTDATPATYSWKVKKKKRK